MVDGRMDSKGAGFDGLLGSPAPEGVWVIDAEARTTFVSERMAQMLRRAPSDIVGRRAVEFLEATGWDDNLRPFPAGERRAGEFCFHLDDGSELRTAVSGTPLRDGRGELQGIIGIFTDLGEQRRVERQKALLFDAITDHITYLDPELRIRYRNHGVTGYRPLAPNEIYGRHCYELGHGRTSPCPDCPALQAIVTGKSAQAEKETPDGRVWALRCFPVLGRRDETIGVVEFALDVTEARRAARALGERDELIRAVLAASRHPVVVIRAVRDERGQIVDFVGILANPAARAMMGPCVGVRLSAAPHATQPPELIAIYRKVVESGEPVTMEYPVGRHGVTAWFLVSGVKLGDGAAVTFTDITQQKLAELDQSSATGRAALRAKEWNLTVAETRVLELVLRGLSNHQIAQQLGCSPRTAEAHVGRILRKSGHSSRLTLVARS
jgi:PAS domain-containing protein/DNA-binding CsgD family transcriptional regulator